MTRSLILEETRPAAGLTVEYNPFHNGHARQLSLLREQCGADTPVVAVLSGSFVQHGEPALLDKWSRAAAAVDNGVDLVLELPVLASLRSADYFAAGAMQALAATGVVRHVFCGAEGLPGKAWGEADALLRETARYLWSAAGNAELRRLLKAGDSYGTAWERAVRTHLPEAGPLLRGSNNILALAYEKAIGQDGLPLVLHLLPRLGQAYTGTEFLPPYASATAIRRFIGHVAPDWPAADRAALDTVMPPPAAERLLQALTRTPAQPPSGSAVPGLADAAPFGDRLAPLLAYFFATHRAEDIYGLCNADAGLCARLWNGRAALQDGWQSYLDRVVTKRYAAPVLHRVCLMLLFGLPRAFWTQGATAPLLRVLAFNGRGRVLLRQMKERASVPILTKAADAERVAATAGEQRLTLLRADFRATDLWCQLRGFQGCFGLDYQISPYYAG
ncbi:MAG: nucleotidyltransferase family protein [Succiniclasticum sp.]|jgi:predicted nucleotidyltransferase|nr:nucleotidyltransferase family protein [Selenomonadales bacterium]MDY6303092.1 nucleotidyltransferase family protein [Succiniclasticum sp.]MDY6345197.1 nucleotidyltransferase family protein [Succiniclasticum sp.]